jgi:hypothetical protein
VAVRRVGGGSEAIMGRRDEKLRRNVIVNRRYIRVVRLGAAGREPSIKTDRFDGITIKGCNEKSPKRKWKSSSQFQFFRVVLVVWQFLVQFSTLIGDFPAAEVSTDL